MEKGKATIWIISEVFHPEETATAHYMTNIATGLTSTHRVRAISILFKSARSQSVPPEENYRGVEITRFLLPGLNKNKLFQRLLMVALSTTTLLLASLFKVRRGDVVLVVTNPPTLPLLLAPIMFLKGAKVILRVDDVYPDALVVANLTQHGSPLYKLALKANILLYRVSSRIVTLGRDMQCVIRARLPKSHQGKVEFIPNWSDLEDIHPSSRSDNPLLKELGIQDKFVILFAGNIGRVQGIPSIIEAASLLQEHPEICLLFIGTGAQEALLRQEMAKRNLMNILLLPNQPRESQHLFLNACDITMLSLAPNMLGMGVPSRLYNYMAAGKPVIGVVEIESEPGRVIDEEKIGWVVPPGDPHLLAEVILQASRSSLLAEMGYRAREAALLHYSQKRIVSMYSELADSL